MLTVKILINRTIYNTEEKFMTIDISNFYLNTPMERPKYLQLKISDMPNNITEQYKMNEKINPNGYVYVKIQKGMYGLPQSGSIAQ